jgi:hypothetical protein
MLSHVVEPLPCKYQLALAWVALLWIFTTMSVVDLADCLWKMSGSAPWRRCLCRTGLMEHEDHGSVRRVSLGGR